MAPRMFFYGPTKPVQEGVLGQGRIVSPTPSPILAMWRVGEKLLISCFTVVVSKLKLSGFFGNEVVEQKEQKGLTTQFRKVLFHENMFVKLQSMRIVVRLDAAQYRQILQPYRVMITREKFIHYLREYYNARFSSDSQAVCSDLLADSSGISGNTSGDPSFPKSLCSSEP